ncbi:VOC family protein [Massilia genomosp. 1]|uniref:VOC family protein n=1 Tax=Massilia genomosp. 1 TaxID=2609280 RepID=A0ABX0MYA9_9BURK|nr:VOC family protein [Massilia genomosp. 1]NHZ66972.1 VOC family protein [Massilia genomosp. 1]
MKRVTGIGGVFFKSPDPPRLAEWYRVHLGFNIEQWGGVAFRWAGPDNPAGTGSTMWSAFKEDTQHFAPSPAAFMINYRVHDLHALMAALRDEGCQVSDQVDESEHGKFAWVIDPDGNKLELWQAPEGQ